MKKIILMAGLLICGITQAQVSVVGNGGNEITEGYEHVTSSLSGPGTILHLTVTNTSEEDVHLKLKVLSMVNADNNDVGSEPQIQFCFGTLCYNEIEPGDMVPAGLTGLTLAPDESNPEGDKFQSIYPGDTPGLDVIYNLQLIQLDDEGNQIAVLRNFSFKYQPTAGINDLTGLANIGINIKNTVVANDLNIASDVAAKLELFDINGRQVKSVDINEGGQAVDLSSLNAAVYIARFTTEENKTSQIRIVKN